MEGKKTKKKHSPLPTGIAILCVLLILGFGVSGAYYATNVRGKDGKDGKAALSANQYTVKTETVREYVTEYLTSPDGTEQIKQLTRDDINAYADTITGYFSANNVQPSSDLTTIENELLEKLSEQLIEKLDMSEIERMIDVAIAAYIKDLQIGGVDTSTDYSALIAELRAKYDSQIEELTSMINDLQSNYNDISTYVQNTTVSVSDVKVLEETISQLKTALEQLNQESNSLTQVTQIFEQDLNILDQKVIENYNTLTEQLAQTNVSIEELHQSFTEDIDTLTQVFGQELTNVYDSLDQYITNQAQLSEMRDMELQQNLEMTANEIRNELNNNVEILNEKLEQTANDIRVELNNNVDILNARISEEVLNLNTRVTNEVNDINNRLQDLRDYVDGYVSSEIDRLTQELNAERIERQNADNEMYDKLANQYQWSKDAYGQDKLTVTTPAKRD